MRTVCDSVSLTNSSKFQIFYMFYFVNNIWEILEHQQKKKKTKIHKKVH